MMIERAFAATALTAAVFVAGAAIPATAHADTEAVHSLNVERTSDMPYRPHVELDLRLLPDRHSSAYSPTPLVFRVGV